MITAVDSNVLIDVLGPDPTHGPASASALREALGVGALVACDPVWAEVAGTHDSAAARQALVELGVGYSPLDLEASLLAGQAWRQYRDGGGSRARVVADFLIGAHARLHADRLLTRDRGFYGGVFEGLEVVEPG